jgi:acetylornithine/LysW-gamma-L-lysine aminotransferase
MSELTDVEDRIGGSWWPKRKTAAMARGEGCDLIDEAGRRYLDFTSAYGTLPLGYGHPELVAALCRQAAELSACPSNLYSAPRARYLARLAGFLPSQLGHVFLCNSGTEANEAAIKFAALATSRA